MFVNVQVFCAGLPSRHIWFDPRDWPDRSDPRDWSRWLEDMKRREAAALEDKEKLQKVVAMAPLMADQHTWPRAEVELWQDWHDLGRRCTSIIPEKRRTVPLWSANPHSSPSPSSIVLKFGGGYPHWEPPVRPWNLDPAENPFAWAIRQTDTTGGFAYRSVLKTEDADTLWAHGAGDLDLARYRDQWCFEPDVMRHSLSRYTVEKMLPLVHPHYLKDRLLQSVWDLLAQLDGDIHAADVVEVLRHEYGTLYRWAQGLDWFYGPDGPNDGGAGPFLVRLEPPEPYMHGRLRYEGHTVLLDARVPCARCGESYVPDGVRSFGECRFRPGPSPLERQMMDRDGDAWYDQVARRLHPEGLDEHGGLDADLDEAVRMGWVVESAPEDRDDDRYWWRAMAEAFPRGRQVVRGVAFRLRQTYTDGGHPGPRPEYLGTHHPASVKPRAGLDLPRAEAEERVKRLADARDRVAGWLYQQYRHDLRASVGALHIFTRRGDAQKPDASPFYSTPSSSGGGDASCKWNPTKIQNLEEGLAKMRAAFFVQNNEIGQWLEGTKDLWEKIFKKERDFNTLWSEIDDEKQDLMTRAKKYIKMMEKKLKEIKADNLKTRQSNVKTRKDNEETRYCTDETQNYLQDVENLVKEFMAKGGDMAQKVVKQNDDLSAKVDILRKEVDRLRNERKVCAQVREIPVPDVDEKLEEMRQEMRKLRNEMDLVQDAERRWNEVVKNYSDTTQKMRSLLEQWESEPVGEEGLTDEAWQAELTKYRQGILAQVLEKFTGIEQLQADLNALTKRVNTTETRMGRNEGEMRDLKDRVSEGVETVKRSVKGILAAEKEALTKLEQSQQARWTQARQRYGRELNNVRVSVSEIQISMKEMQDMVETLREKLNQSTPPATTPDLTSEFDQLRGEVQKQMDELKKETEEQILEDVQTFGREMLRLQNEFEPAPSDPPALPPTEGPIVVEREVDYGRVVKALVDSAEFRTLVTQLQGFERNSKARYDETQADMEKNKQALKQKLDALRNMPQEQLSSPIEMEILRGLVLTLNDSVRLQQEGWARVMEKIKQYQDETKGLYQALRQDLDGKGEYWSETFDQLKKEVLADRPTTPRPVTPAASEASTSELEEEAEPALEQFATLLEAHKNEMDIKLADMLTTVDQLTRPDLSEEERQRLLDELAERIAPPAVGEPEGPSAEQIRAWIVAEIARQLDDARNGDQGHENLREAIKKPLFEPLKECGGDVNGARGRLMLDQNAAFQDQLASKQAEIESLEAKLRELEGRINSQNRVYGQQMDEWDEVVKGFQERVGQEERKLDEDWRLKKGELNSLASDKLKELQERNNAIIRDIDAREANIDQKLGDLDELKETIEKMKQETGSLEEKVRGNLELLQGLNEVVNNAETLKGDLDAAGQEWLAKLEQQAAQQAANTAELIRLTQEQQTQRQELGDILDALSAAKDEAIRGIQDEGGKVAELVSALEGMISQAEAKRGELQEVTDRLEGDRARWEDLEAKMKEHDQNRKAFTEFWNKGPAGFWEAMGKDPAYFTKQIEEFQTHKETINKTLQMALDLQKWIALKNAMYDQRMEEVIRKMKAFDDEYEVRFGMFGIMKERTEKVEKLYKEIMDLNLKKDVDDKVKAQLSQLEKNFATEMEELLKKKDFLPRPDFQAGQEEQEKKWATEQKAQDDTWKKQLDVIVTEYEKKLTDMQSKFDADQKRQDELFQQLKGQVTQLQKLENTLNANIESIKGQLLPQITSLKEEQDTEREIVKGLVKQLKALEDLKSDVDDLRKDIDKKADEDVVARHGRAIDALQKKLNALGETGSQPTLPVDIPPASKPSVKPRPVTPAAPPSAQKPPEPVGVTLYDMERVDKNKTYPSWHRMRFYKEDEKTYYLMGVEIAHPVKPNKKMWAMSPYPRKMTYDEIGKLQGSVNINLLEENEHRTWSAEWKAHADKATKLLNARSTDGEGHAMHLTPSEVLDSKTQSLGRYGQSLDKQDGEKTIPILVTDYFMCWDGPKKEIRWARAQHDGGDYTQLLLFFTGPAENMPALSLKNEEVHAQTVWLDIPDKYRVKTGTKSDGNSWSLFNTPMIEVDLPERHYLAMSYQILFRFKLDAGGVTQTDGYQKVKEHITKIVNMEKAFVYEYVDSIIRYVEPLKSKTIKEVKDRLDMWKEQQDGFKQAILASMNTKRDYSVVFDPENVLSGSCVKSTDALSCRGESITSVIKTKAWSDHLLSINSQNRNASTFGADSWIDKYSGTNVLMQYYMRRLYMKYFISFNMALQNGAKTYRGFIEGEKSALDKTKAKKKDNLYVEVVKEFIGLLAIENDTEHNLYGDYKYKHFSSLEDCVDSRYLFGYFTQHNAQQWIDRAKEWPRWIAGDLDRPGSTGSEVVSGPSDNETSPRPGSSGSYRSVNSNASNDSGISVRTGKTATSSRTVKPAIPEAQRRKEPDPDVQRKVKRNQGKAVGWANTPE